jgi:hypothetical protein
MAFRNWHFCEQFYIHIARLNAKNPKRGETAIARGESTARGTAKDSLLNGSSASVGPVTSG